MNFIKIIDSQSILDYQYLLQIFSITSFVSFGQIFSYDILLKSLKRITDYSWVYKRPQFCTYNVLEN